MHRTVVKILTLIVLIPLLIASSALVYYYYRYSRLIDRKLAGTSWGMPSEIYAAPYLLYPGRKIGKETLVERLKRTGYKENSGPKSSNTKEPVFHWASSSVLEISNSDDDLNSAKKVKVRFNRGAIRDIRNAATSQPVQYFGVRPEVISTVFNKNREKYKYVRFDEIPPHLVNAVLASEDKRFFKHGGIDVLSVFRALFADINSKGVLQGGSTITQQFVKNFFLTPERTWRRKLSEAYLALLLEKKYSKQKIFEFYSNKVYLGQRGSFSIVGFAEAAEAYFGKNLREINLSEAAFLAAMIRAPNKYSPYRYPERARQRRDAVLDLMQEDGFITKAEKLEAKKHPLQFKSLSVFNYSDAPYFVDYVRDQLLQEVPEEELTKRSYKIYTTLNMDLQKAAYEAVNNGLKRVDAALSKKKTADNVSAQACLIALDPRTGDILAMVGGRNYVDSQFNRVTEAKRQPGSSFKPFVYAAALERALSHPDSAITTVSTVVDEPTTFVFGSTEYEPRNYKNEYHGPVTLRQAATYSLNVATVKFAERAGYDNVVALARRIGLEGMQPYPSIALGTSEATPLEIARAYTVFANQGVLVEPVAIKKIVRGDRTVLQTAQVAKRPVLSSETAFLITNLLQSVISSGTGAGVRARGFVLPAAGKTGTSHDGWFAGYTPDLLCIVWVGFDDYRELKLSGSQSALPIWADFMKKAAAILPLKGEDFSPPDGVVAVDVDPMSGLLATPSCPNRRTEYFIKGTEPKTFCTEQGTIYYTQGTPNQPDLAPHGKQDENKPKEKKKGWFRRIFPF